MSKQAQGPAISRRQLQQERIKRLKDVVAKHADGNQSEFVRRVFPGQVTSKRSDLSRWLKGLRDLDVGDYVRIAEYTGESIDWLLARPEAQEAKDHARPITLVAARRALLEELFDRFLESGDFEALQDRAGVYSQECTLAGLEAVKDEFSTPRLVKLYGATYSRAFRAWLGIQESRELTQWRHAAARPGRVPWQPGDLRQHLRGSFRRA